MVKAYITDMLPHSPVSMIRAKEEGDDNEQKEV